MQTANVSSPAAIGSNMQTGITSFGAWMIGVGSIIGSMAWLIHGTMLARAGALATLCAWILAGVMTLPLVAILSELSSMFPAVGGPYVYKLVALKRLAPRGGELMGFLAGWLYWIAMITGIACMANGLADLVANACFASGSDAPLWFGPIVIAGLFLSTTILNQAPVKDCSRLNNVMTGGKILMAVGFCLLVSRNNSAGSNLFHALNYAGAESFMSRLGGALLLAVVGFSGMEVVGCTASETHDARLSVPKAIIRTWCTVILIYSSLTIAISAAANYGLSPDRTTAVVAGTQIPATCPAIAGYLGGPMLGTLMTVGVIISIVACTFNALLAMARISFSMAETGLFPRYLAVLSPVTKIPGNALWFQFWFLCSISIVANIAAKTNVCPDAFAFLGEVFGLLYACLAVLYGLSLISLRYTEADMVRPFRIGSSGNGLAWLAVITAGGLYSYVAVTCTTPLQQVTATFLLLVGIPIYGYYRWRR